MLRCVAAIELAELPGHLKTDQQCANPEGEGVGCRSQLKAAYAHYEKVSGNGVEKAPQHIYRR
jgi:hypothetical protein